MIKNFNFHLVKGVANFSCRVLLIMENSVLDSSVPVLGSWLLSLQVYAPCCLKVSDVTQCCPDNCVINLWISNM